MSSPEIVAVHSSAPKRRRVFVDLTGAGSDSHSEAPEVVETQQQARRDRKEPVFWLNKLRGARNDYAYTLQDLVPGEPVDYLLVSAFMFDMPWVAEAAPKLLDAKETLLLHGHKDETGAMALQLFAATANAADASRKITVFAPLVPNRYGTHHSKILAFVCQSGLRLVIHTANMLEGDFTLKTQGGWIRDFPKKTEKSPNTSPFEKDLDDYFARVGDPSRRFRSLMKAFDFSQAGAQLIASVPGEHNDSKYGLRRVRHLLRSRQYAETDPLICQFSSLGSLNPYWLKTFTSAFGSANTPANLVWPTKEQVRTSVAGWSSGGTLACTRKNMKPIVQKLLHKWDAQESRRSVFTPHIKSYCRGTRESLHWVILSSANLSQVAWGAVWKGQYNVQSYELGVMLFPDILESSGLFLGGGLGIYAKSVRNAKARFVATTSATKELPDEAIAVPLPHNIEAPAYSNSDTAWVWDEAIDELDILGNRWEV